MSLLHYQDYINENDDTRKAQLLRAHIQSIRTHFMGLSRKSYQNIEALDTVDFVFMFVPVEPAYLLALREEPGLRVVAAWQGGALAGFCVAHLARGSNFIYELHVAPASRRCGLGCGLLDEVAGVAALQLNVHAANTDALAFYAYAGFTQRGGEENGILKMARKRGDGPRR